MDKELAQLHDLAREMLLDIQAKYEAKTLPPGFGKSDKKRLDKAISNLDFNTEAYGNIMEDVMSGDLGPKELMKKIRNEERRVMKAFELLNEDTIHHLVQQRTGGDFSKQVSGDVVSGAMRRLEDRFGLKFSQATGPGGVIRGDTALSNYAHKSDLTQKGAELESGIGKNPNPETTAHRLGTTGYSRTLTAAETVDEDALVAALEARIAPQLEDVKVGIATDQPRVQAIRKAAPGLERAYMFDNTPEEIAKMQPIARGLPKETLIKTYKAIPEAYKGGFRMSFFGLDEIGKVITKNLTGAIMGAFSAIEPEAITAALQGDYQKAAEATTVGAGFGAAVQQTLTKAPVIDKVKAISTVGKVPGAVSFAKGVATFAGPVGIATTGLQLIDAAAKGITGKGMFEPSGRPVTEEELDFSTL
jgi:hypothetical protein